MAFEQMLSRTRRWSLERHRKVTRLGGLERLHLGDCAYYG
jgi:hypothetical protein